MKIYDVSNFPNPIRVRIALAEKKASGDVTFIPVDVMAGEHRTEAFLRKNPAAAVPIAELDDGTCIAECSAIIEYIDHTFEGPSLTGNTPRQRAVIHMMQRRAEFMVLDAVGAYYHHATEGLGKELEKNQIPEWGEQQRQVAINGMKYFNNVLAAQNFVAGEEFSTADITLFAGLAFADFAGISIPNECQYLIEWRSRVNSRPSVAE